MKTTENMTGRTMLVEAILIGTMTITSYRAVPEQTKPECRGRNACTTSINENVSELGVAVSQDLLASGKIRYRDILLIPGVGYRIVNDCTHHRLRNHVDVFVYDKASEKAFGVKKLQVWVIRTPYPYFKKGKPNAIQELSK